MDLWATVEWEQPLKKIQQPIPEPQGKEVLIKVTHCGVCHSDLHFWEGFYDLGNGKRFYVKDRGVKLPVAMGHEILGNIAKLGPDVDASQFPLGARRIVYPWLGCGNCFRCKAEQDNLCVGQQGLGTLKNGGFAEYVVVPDAKYLIDPGDVDPAVACTFGCSGITTLSALRKILPMPADEPIVLIGAGGLGLAAISMLKAFEHKNIISVDIAQEKLDAAKKAGASIVINSTDSNAVDKIKEACGGNVLTVVDFVNNSATAAMVNGMVVRGANWVQVGVMGGSIELSLVANIFRGLTIYSNITGNLADLREVTKLARDRKLPPLPVTTMPWNSVSEAMDLLRQGKVTGRIVLVKE